MSDLEARVRELEAQGRAHEARLVALEREATTRPDHRRPSSTGLAAAGCPACGRSKRYAYDPIMGIPCKDAFHGDTLTEAGAVFAGATGKLPQK